MASYAALHLPSSSSHFTTAFKTLPSFGAQLQVCKPLGVKASTSLGYSTTSHPDRPPTYPKNNIWQWKYKENSVNIYYEAYEMEKDGYSMDILMMPTISDVSTVEEWRSVAEDIVGRDGASSYRATIVDWPGLGYSDRPKLEYTADLMEKFLVDFINAPGGPLSSSGNDLVVVGGGHAATIAVRAANKGLLKPIAIAAIAPTWAGPLPIVFGKDSNMETSYGAHENVYDYEKRVSLFETVIGPGHPDPLRYGLLRGTLRAPAVGWMMYNVLVSNKKSIESQYKSHVYADPENVTASFIESRYALTKQRGARYVPAAFLTGLLDPVKSREEFVQLFAGLQGSVPILVISTPGSPKRSKAEMEVLREAEGVSKYVPVPGALLPQEEYPEKVAEELYRFLQEYLS